MRRRRWRIGQTRERYVAPGEVLTRDRRIIVHTVRPAAAGADFATLEALGELPGLAMHPVLRGEIPPSGPTPEGKIRLHSVWAVYDVTADELPAEAIVERIFATAPGDLSFSIHYADTLRTATEITDAIEREVRDLIARVPGLAAIQDGIDSARDVLRSVARLARRAGRSTITPVVMLVGGVAVVGVVAYAYGRGR